MDLHHLLRRTKTLTAIVTVGAAVVAAGPAGAEPNTTPPAKKGCEVQLKGPGAGQSIVYADGYKFSVTAANDGKTHTYTCNDGKWTETVALTAPPLRFGGVAAPIGTFTVLASGAGQFALPLHATPAGAAGISARA
jgi:hypothetical protein